MYQPNVAAADRATIVVTKSNMKVFILRPFNVDFRNLCVVFLNRFDFLLATIAVDIYRL